MSRHQLTPQPARPRIEVVIGWDRPLRTFYAQVLTLDDNGDETDDNPYLWVGTDYDEITDPAAVLNAVRPYAVLPDDLTGKLLADAVREGARLWPTVGDIAAALLTAPQRTP